MPSRLRNEVDTFCYGPKPFHKELLEVSFDGDMFHLVTSGGYSRESEITDSEDVSYVSSPYLPK